MVLKVCTTKFETKHCVTPRYTYLEGSGWIGKGSGKINYALNMVSLIVKRLWALFRDLPATYSQLLL